MYYLSSGFGGLARAEYWEATFENQYLLGHMKKYIRVNNDKIKLATVIILADTIEEAVIRAKKSDDVCL